MQCARHFECRVFSRQEVIREDSNPKSESAGTIWKIVSGLSLPISVVLASQHVMFSLCSVRELEWRAK